MDGLSAVASGFAVVSLAVQLIDCVGTIRAFIRNVKDAQRELERLVDLLERLEALLEDVRALMDRQTSLEAQHFPAPSATISRCLKSCEKTLEPLQAIVYKHAPSKSKASTSMDRLKHGLRIGFKSKDIQDFETRIEREINFLHASLGANCGAILMQLGPALLRNQSNHATTSQGSTTLSSSNTETAVVSPRKHDTRPSNAGDIRCSLTVIPIHSPLERLGIYQKKTVRRVPCSSGKSAPGYRQDVETVVSEDHETTFLWSVLGYGLTWIQRRSFGRVVPSLSVFPVFSKLPYEVHYALSFGDMEDFQDLLRRGVIHPFSHDTQGRSLLHFAADKGRADIYQMLRKLGLKQSVSIYGETPLKTVGERPHSTRADTIALLRHILEDTELVDDFSPKTWSPPFFNITSVEVLRWFYYSSADMLSREDSAVVQASLFWRIWTYMVLMVGMEPLSLAAFPSLELDAEVLELLKLEEVPPLVDILMYCSFSCDSFVTGDKFLEWISSSSTEVEQFLRHEVERANTWDEPADPPKRYVLEARQGGGWRLGFEHVFDSTESGYLVVSKFESLAVPGVRNLGWPFDQSRYYRGFLNEVDREWEEGRNGRFQRRMDTRARKQSGQKRRKSRMPGAWVH